MPSTPDPYRILGVAREATAGEIRTAHRRLAKQYHPDATGGDTERFLAVQEAYQVLSDPLRRREWDARHRPGRGQTNRQRRRPDPVSSSGRDPSSDSYTWSAQDVPWWSSGPRGAAGTDPDAASGAAGSRGGATRRAAPSGADFDVYNRSSGAAWSMASRAYFRRAGSDVPRGAAEPFGQRWTTPRGTPSTGPGPAAAPAAATAPRATAGRAHGVVFGSPAHPAAARSPGHAATWPSAGGRLLYAVLGWVAPAAALTLGPLAVPVPITSGLLSALAVGLLLAPRPAYLAAVGGMAALVAGAGFALGLAASGGALGVAFDALAAAVVVMVYLGAVILACLDWPIPRPWSDPG